MNRTATLFALALLAAPLAVSAQTANTPGGSAATGTPLDQSKPTGQMAPTGNTQTNPSATNPGGTLSKGGSMSAPSSTNGAAMGDDMKKAKAKAKPGRGANDTATGDVPTYPAPAKDGTPTK